jgi:hypothetical protein
VQKVFYQPVPGAMLYQISIDCRINRSTGSVPTRYNLEQSLVKWIEQNLKSRFYVGKTITVSNTNSIENMTKVGFEEAKELSYFTLACPYLKYN